MPARALRGRRVASRSGEAGGRNRNMDPTDILAEYYDRGSKTFEILVAHGNQVARKAIAAAEQVSHLKPDLDFIVTAAMLHDIGIRETIRPGLGCNGKHPYICHGILGRELMETCAPPGKLTGLTITWISGTAIGSTSKMLARMRSRIGYPLVRAKRCAPGRPGDQS